MHVTNIVIFADLTLYYSHSWAKINYW